MCSEDIQSSDVDACEETALHVMCFINRCYADTGKTTSRPVQQSILISEQYKQAFSYFLKESWI